MRGKYIALFNVEGEFFALDNACTHDEGPLADLPLARREFDIRTGEVLGPPAYESVARYAVRVAGTDIEVEVQ